MQGRYDQGLANQIGLARIGLAPCVEAREGQAKRRREDMRPGYRCPRQRTSGRRPNWVSGEGHMDRDATACPGPVLRGHRPHARMDALDREPGDLLFDRSALDFGVGAWSSLSKVNYETCVTVTRPPPWQPGSTTIAHTPIWPRISNSRKKVAVIHEALPCIAASSFILSGSDISPVANSM